ncbi:hypothetical protein E4U17_002109 [Claviceps sp. LM77 group G4]|nr:hypothetical protein E4U17_002109 [Claviceps sp. LM77 group G4]KAG6083813.1 hypothetical protein E4U16_003309 [Claviceps sp. LM84 group G4]KAG6085221.1 hypothetical protein E4U33_002206 [Claviceps sp. LM78 group G4]
MAKLRRLTAAVLTVALPVAQALYFNGSVVAPCDSPIYCHGDILKEIELARPFADSKTFVDMPAIRPLKVIQEAFGKLEKPLKNDTALHDFLSTYFADAGQELEQVPRANLTTNPQFLDKLNDTVIKEFVTKVIDIWPDLTRTYSGSGSNCSDCPSSFIPVKRPFVVAGGRFREPYYWDSYWILEGLLRTKGSFTEIAKNTIENFLDFVEQFGFVPNGARVYYLNRSQPPLLSQMVKLYIEHTNDTSILDRALPLLVKEHDFWMTNRTVEVEANGKTHRLNRYAVSNTQPRPESFREDYQMATNSSYYAKSGIIYPERKKLNESERMELYSSFAASAESGMDFSSRWLANPSDSARDVYFPLRSNGPKNVIPVCLNSILYGNEVAIAQFFNKTGNSTAAREWMDMAETRSEAIHAVMWNETLFSYFDYNMTSSAQNIYTIRDDDSLPSDENTAPPGHQVVFHMGQFYPFWQGAAPAYLKNNPHAVKTVYARVVDYLRARPGGVPTTNIQTSTQWDQPNVWPSMMHILMVGLLKTPPTFGEDDPSYKDVRDTALTLGQRYLDSTFCTWYATGGSTSATPKLQGLTDKQKGIMFEKYSDNAVNRAGSGGEYEVVEGFGWTNGVLMYAADVFGNDLKRPNCGDIKPARPDGEAEKRSLSAIELAPGDARRVKKFGTKADN